MVFRFKNIGFSIKKHRFFIFNMQKDFTKTKN